MDGLFTQGVTSFPLFIKIRDKNGESRILEADVLPVQLPNATKAIASQKIKTEVMPPQPALSSTPEPPEFRCASCAENFDSKTTFDIHMSGHANNMKCSICNMVLKSIKNYEKHCLRCKPYVCQICNRVVRFRPNFIKHMRVHSGQQSQRLKYKCEVCCKEFMSFEYFKVHKKIHSLNLNLTCKVCGKVFSALASLRGHMKLHTGVQLHTCDVCGKGFGQRYNLKIHSRVHTGILPYECSTCNKKFHTESSYETHLKTHISPIAHETIPEDSPKDTPELINNVQNEKLPNSNDFNTIIIKEEPLDSSSDLFKNIPVKSRMKTISDFLESSSNLSPMYGMEDNLIESNDLPYSNIFDIDSVSQGIPANDSYLDERDVSFRSDSSSADIQCTTTTDGNFIRKEWVYSHYSGVKFDSDSYCHGENFIYE